MAIQTFTSGQTLTAAQMTTLQTNDYNWSINAQTASYVLVAADAGKVVTMTNASATTITVNSSLFAAGDTVRIINLGAGTTTITAGTATVNAAASLALPQYASGTLWFSSASAAIFIPDDRTPGLALITSASVSAAASFSLAASTFTTSFAHYRIVGAFTSSATGASQTVTMRLRASGTDNTNSEYLFSNMRGSSAISGATAASGTTTSFLIVPGMTAPNRINFSIDIYNPQATDYTAISGTCAALQNNADMFSILPTGVMSVTTSYDSATFIISSGGFTGGYRVYGYN